MTFGIDYVATDVASDFHNDDSFVRLLIGPVGCGKSVAGCLEILSRALRQPKGSDGIRRSRWAVIRNTYPELKATTIKTWLSWYPEEHLGNIKYDSPITHHIRFKDVDLEVVFLALDRPADISKLMSFELTGAYINEAQFIEKPIFEKCLERVDRYPSKKDGGELGWSGVIMDTNPPDTDHWLYKMFEEKKPSGYKLFKYDSPLRIVKEIPAGGKEGFDYNISMDGTLYIHNPVDYLVIQKNPLYWMKLIPGKKDSEIKVNIMGLYGVFIDGLPVHATYNDLYHHSDNPVIYNPSIELGLGWDFGRTPAVAIVQYNPMSQLIVLDEIWSEDMSLRDFCESDVLSHLDKNFPGWQNNYLSVHDPAGENESQEDSAACVKILKDFGIKSFPAAGSNIATPRRDGLKYFLGRMIGGRPSFVLGPKAKLIRKGLMGGFQYRRVQVSGEARYHDKPLKNMCSHICEALEYIAMWYAPKSKKPEPSTKKPYRIHTGSFMAL